MPKNSTGENQRPPQPAGYPNEDPQTKKKCCPRSKKKGDRGFIEGWKSPRFSHLTLGVPSNVSKNYSVPPESIKLLLEAIPPTVAQKSGATSSLLCAAVGSVKNASKIS
ncbi:hypothetical protein CJ030_MR2G001816 [Morella rubra]|uniref:Uncharacterized protein n=1 Tax=Morella rubra TaxID=262757 RepID=A0A6A1WAI2_9ROSI|nr:hypothetical protein CJ030_MR2G001816 [Morella rubra]